MQQKTLTLVLIFIFCQKLIDFYFFIVIMIFNYPLSIVTIMCLFKKRKPSETIMVTTEEVSVVPPVKETPAPTKIIVPERDVPLTQWEEFATKHNWSIIRQLLNKFVPRVNDKQDEAILKILRERLRNIETPVLSNAFINNHGHEIIWVKDGEDTTAIKEVVSLSWLAYNKPCFVVAKSRKLIGFALSQNLIIVGATAVAFKAKTVMDTVQAWSLSLLTRDDSETVETSFFKLNHMMKVAQVPRIDFYDWMLQPQNDRNHSPYEGFDIQHEKRYTHYSGADYTNILVKL